MEFLVRSMQEGDIKQVRVGCIHITVLKIFWSN